MPSEAYLKLYVAKYRVTYFEANLRENKNEAKSLDLYSVIVTKQYMIKTLIKSLSEDKRPCTVSTMCYVCILESQVFAMGAICPRCVTFE